MSHSTDPNPNQPPQPGGKGVSVLVKYWDSHVETVRVRIIPREDMRKMDEVLVATNTLGDDLEVAFYVGRDKGWAATLDDDSYGAVLDAGHALNLKRFADWHGTRAPGRNP